MANFKRIFDMDSDQIEWGEGDLKLSDIVEISTEDGDLTLTTKPEGLRNYAIEQTAESFENLMESLRVSVSSKGIRVRFFDPFRTVKGNVFEKIFGLAEVVEIRENCDFLISKLTKMRDSLPTEDD